MSEDERAAEEKEIAIKLGEFESKFYELSKNINDCYNLVSELVSESEADQQ